MERKDSGIIAEGILFGFLYIIGLIFVVSVILFVFGVSLI